MRVTLLGGVSGLREDGLSGGVRGAVSGALGGATIGGVGAAAAGRGAKRAILSSLNKADRARPADWLRARVSIPGGAPRPQAAGTWGTDEFIRM